MKKTILLAVLAALSIVVTITLCLLVSETLLWIRYLAIGLNLLILVVIGGLFWRAHTKPTGNHEQQILIKQDSRVVHQLFSLAAKKIRGSGRNKLDSLYTLPWYLMVGSESRDRISLLQQNGLEPVTDHLTDNDETAQYLRFWSNDHMVVIEVGHRLFDGEGIDDPLWRVLARQLLKYRPRQGLNGIIPLLSCHQLLTANRTERKKFASLLQEACLSLSTTLKVALPVYPMFSEAESLSDFAEFFACLPTDQVERPLGLTFECNAGSLARFDKASFDKQIDELLSSLAEQQLVALRHAGIEQAGRVVALPYQLKMLFQRIREFLADLGRENRVRQSVWLRGMYLFSTGQQGARHDLLTLDLAERTEFSRRETADVLPNHNVYFCSRLLRDVVLPERNITGQNSTRKWGYFAGRAALVAVVFGTVSTAAMTMKHNWDQDEKWRADAITELRVYENDAHRLGANYTNADIVPLLNALRQVANAGIAPRAWYQHVSFRQDQTARQVYHTYERQLQALLLPKLETQISEELSVYINLGNPSKIFEVLRYYQMLFDHNQLDSNEIRTFLMENLSDQGQMSVDDISAISLLIEDLFNSQYDDKLAPNRELINLAANNLDGLSKERLIYARIKTLPAFRGNVDIRHQLGDKFGTLFEFSDDFHGYLMPEIFTRYGYGQIDLSAKSELLRHQLKELKAVENDNSVLSVVELTELSKKVQRLYFADYIHHWQDLLAHINVRQFSDPQDLANALKLAREPVTSPVMDLLGAVVVNTSLAEEKQPQTKENKKLAKQLGLKKVAKGLTKADKINRAAGKKLLRLQPSFAVNDAFVSFSRYVNVDGKKAPLDGLIGQFGALNTFIGRALSSSDPGKTFHDMALAHAKGSKDAIVEFRSVASTAPAPVEKWTKDIASQAWHLVMNGSARYLDEQWNARVYRFYVEAIEGRFPFAQKGRGEVSLDDFSAMFKPHGRLDGFIEAYLQPFVYWDNGVLKRNTIDGLQLPLDARVRQQLQIAKKLSRVFFGLSGQQLAMTLSVQPKSMSTSVTAFKMAGQETLFSYRHGPRVWTDITWPMSSIDGYLRLDFFDGENRVASTSYRGQWALFRALFDAKGHKSSARLVRGMDYRLDDKDISFDVLLKDADQPLNKELFSAFHLPEHL
ncbi:type VI secretion system membrane subunit TssM [Veronia pacifica]|uniref:IcmF-related protein n=1 Tax=Veronia pacifica TaxID=1080227 RepID=A0A1C3EDS5_9GAMM|nr:type VI secretion system membrane subunit TssM [Veronia pacifica]ODA31373.1 IcmF-related protein [Veronia pacifica]